MNAAQKTTTKPAWRPARATSERGRLITLLHVAKKDLALDDAAYRTLLQTAGGANSSKDMTAEQLTRVLEKLKQSGFKVKPKAQAQAKGSTPGRAPITASDPESRKARAMWLTLHHIGQVRDASETALAAYALRMCKVQRLEWVQDFFPLIESLKAWLERSLPDYVRPYLYQTTATWARHMAPAWHENWRQAVLRFQRASNSHRQHILDEWLDLWQLIRSTQDQEKQP